MNYELFKMSFQSFKLVLKLTQILVAFIVLLAKSTHVLFL